MSVSKLLGICCWFFAVGTAVAQMGGIRGTIMDQDFEVPLPGAKIRISETGQETTSGDSGSYYLENVKPGSYTLLFSKSGYSRYTKSGVVVSPGQLTELEAPMAGEYEEMDELVVRDIQMGGASEIGLLNLRMDSSALMDSVGADLISRAGASDAAGALKLVSGTTVQDGKYAVVRGLPDRYVVSLLNGVRLPSADPDKRAVQLDQYPSSLIESVRVVKTFTPDQQGDASGGAVDVVLRGIPEERVLKFSIGTKYNENDAGDDFLSYDTSDNNYLGQRDFNPPADLGSARNPDPQIIPGSYGSKTADQPFNYSWGIELGDRYGIELFGEDVSVGAIATFNYEQSAFHTEKIADNYNANSVATEYLGLEGQGRLVPQIKNFNPDSPDYSIDNPAHTELLDITKSTHEINWSGALGVGLEHDLFELNYLHVFTHNAEDSAVLSENTRGRQIYNSQYLDYIDPNAKDSAISPYRTAETLLYKERDTKSDQLGGELELPIPDLNILNILTLKQPVIDWKLSQSSSSLMEPNKRVLEHYWLPGEVTRDDDPSYDWTVGISLGDFDTYFDPNSAWLSDFKNSVGESLSPPKLSSEFADSWGWIVDDDPDLIPTHGWYNEDVNPTEEGGVKPGVITGVGDGQYYGLEAGEQLGNFQLIWQKIIEESDQAAFNYKWDFENWTSDKGLLKAGLFRDRVDRKFVQQTLSNKVLTQGGMPIFTGEWEDSAADLFSSNSLTYSSQGDVGYAGVQDLDAWYYMAEFPVFDFLTLKGGVRHEEFTLQTFLKPDDARIAKIVKEGEATALLQSDGQGGFIEDADYHRVDDLPSVGFDLTPIEKVILRFNWAQTVAKQQFKEVVPIIQREYAGADAFVGNPDLRASPVDNLDFRLDYTPYPGGLVSASFFYKDITDPIEYYQGQDNPGNSYTFVTNYPSATVKGWELEIRQGLGRYVSALEGMNVGGNFTSIEGELDIGSGITRDVMQMPEYLYNLFWTYDLGVRDIKIGLFYTQQGDTLKVNKPEQGTIPAVYALPYGSLNLSLSGKLSDNVKLSFQAKNLTNPEIQTVYREDGYAEEVHTSYTKGRSYSVGITGTW